MGVPQTAEPKTAETQLPNAWLGPAGWSKRNTMIGAALAVLVGATIAMLGIQAAFQRSPSPVSAAPPAAPQEPTRAAQGNSNAPVPAVSGDAGLNGR